jgi:hypothetical protein
MSRKHFKNRFKSSRKYNKTRAKLQKPKVFSKNQGGGVVEIVTDSDPSLVSGNYNEKYEPVFMEMASAKAEIRYVFGFTFFSEQVLH